MLYKHFKQGFKLIQRKLLFTYNLNKFINCSIEKERGKTANKKSLVIRDFFKITFINIKN